MLFLILSPNGVYFSVYDGQTWSIQHIWREDSSNDSDGWSVAEPTSILGLDQENIGAAVVSVESDRYRMWHAIQMESDSDHWQIAAAESSDGVEWHSLDVAIWSEIEHSSAPRAALRAIPARHSVCLESKLGSSHHRTSHHQRNTIWLAATPLAGQWIDTDSFRSYSAGGAAG